MCVCVCVCVCVGGGGSGGGGFIFYFYFFCWGGRGLIQTFHHYLNQNPILFFCNFFPLT